MVNAEFDILACDMSAHRRALVLLATCGLCWSTAGVLIKLVAWHPLAIWSVRGGIAALALYAIRRPSLRNIARAEWAAACALALSTGLFVIANKLTTAANAILIQYSAPIWVALLGAWFLGERASRVDWATIAAVIVGIALFFVEQLTLDHFAGNLVAAAGGVAYAAGALTMRKAALDPNIDPLRPLLLGNALAAVLGLPFWFASPAPDANGWLALIALGIVQQALAYLCYAGAIRHVTALEAMLMPVIEPIASPVWVALAFGERPGPWALAGGAIVIGAVVVRATRPRTATTLRTEPAA